MKLLVDRVMPIQSPLYSFNGEVIMPKGVITLHVTLGMTPKHLNLIIDFMVFKVSSAYNMMFSRPCMRMEKAILSTYHLVIKFLTKSSI